MDCRVNQDVAESLIVVSLAKMCMETIGVDFDENVERAGKGDDCL
jgi:hypothetical protein